MSKTQINDLLNIVCGVYSPLTRQDQLKALEYLVEEEGLPLALAEVVLRGACDLKRLRGQKSERFLSYVPVQ